MIDNTILNWKEQFDSGIYKITNTINGKVYIGQSIHLRQRIRFHRTINCEHNKHLKRAFEKYGIENFTFEIIKETYDLNFWERFFIYWYKADNPRYGYNILKGGESCPSKNEKTRKKMSKNIKKFYDSEKKFDTNPMYKQIEGFRILKPDNIAAFADFTWIKAYKNG